MLGKWVPTLDFCEGLVSDVSSVTFPSGEVEILQWSDYKVQNFDENCQ
jgi:hypothetical protein